MKLELKHLAPYLPYDLKFYDKKDDFNFTLETANLWRVIQQKCKPILRPLSDLTKEIQSGGKIWYPTDHWDDHSDGLKLNSELINMAEHNYCDFHLPYFVMEKLFEWHFDVFGLIPKGLAIEKPQS